MNPVNIFTSIAIPLLITLMLSAATQSESADLSDLSHLPRTSFQDAFTWQASLQQVDAPTPLNNFSIIENRILLLAGNRTDRINPLDNFKKYRNGWNISNVNYWASVGFTGAPGFVLSPIWVGLGLLFCISLCCCPAFPKGHPPCGIAFPFFLLLLFTSVSVVGCALIYFGQGEFHNHMSETLAYVVNQSDVVVENLRNLSVTLTKVESIDVMNFSLPASEKSNIREINSDLSNAADELQTRTKDNRHKIRAVMDLVRISMIVISASMLLLVGLGLVFTVMRAAPLVYILVFIGWLLVAGTWVLCGLYILLNNAMEDTCVAMEEWVANPSAKTNLDEILPCVDVNTAIRTLSETELISKDTTNGINFVISYLNSFPSEDLPLPLLCVPEVPTPGCLTYEEAPKVWKSHLCNAPLSNGTCTIAGRRVSNETYEEMKESVEIIEELQKFVPFLLHIRDCTFVRITFSNISEVHCPELWKWSKLQYIGLALVSSGSMFSIIFWIVYTRVRSRKHDHGSNHPISMGEIGNRGPSLKSNMH